PYPVAYPRQVFQGNSTAGALRFIHQMLADAMIHVMSKAGLFAGQLLQPAFGRLRSLLLELRPQPLVAVANAIDVAGGMKLAVAVNGDVRHTQVNTQRAVHVNRIGFLYVAGSEQVELAPMEDQIAFSLPGLEQRKLVRSGGKGD